VAYSVSDPAAPPAAVRYTFLLDTPAGSAPIVIMSVSLAVRVNEPDS
jgi:hypothetical protein